MVEFEKHTLPNGLRVIVHRDETTPIAAVNLLYGVGARDEDPDKTGFAHLFEHLMFEGSVNVKDFDHQLQNAGGENNAFTTNDITNYYLTLPVENLETAFWLESDRMKGLAFSEEKLRIQKNVVTEEFRQSFLNQPYGDLWLLLRPLAYKVHPYQWATIGKNIQHIQDTSLQDVKDFFRKYYHPANAILTVVGNVEAREVFAMAEKWFGEIQAFNGQRKKLPREPEQKEERRLVAERQVPFSQIYIAFHMAPRNHPEFFPADLLSDVLANGNSSRLLQDLVKKQRIFSEANAYVSGSLDKGLFVVTGKLHPETPLEKAEEALWKHLDTLANQEVGEEELQKVKNKFEASHVFSESNVLGKAMNLAYYEFIGDADFLNRQIDQYWSLEAGDLQKTAASLFRKEKANTLYYKAVDYETTDKKSKEEA